MQIGLLQRNRYQPQGGVLKNSSLEIKEDEKIDKMYMKSSSFSPSASKDIDNSSPQYNNIIVNLSDNSLHANGGAYYLDGEKVDLNKLDKETLSFIDELESYGSSLGTKAISSLVNKYDSMKEKLSENYTGDELEEKLNKLDKAFDMISETRVKKPAEEQLGFKMSIAKHNKKMEDLMEKYRNKAEGSSAKIKQIDSSLNDDDKNTIEFLKDTLKELFKKAKNGESFAKEQGNLNSIYKVMNSVFSPGTYSLKDYESDMAKSDLPDYVKNAMNDMFINGNSNINDGQYRIDEDGKIYSGVDISV